MYISYILDSTAHTMARQQYTVKALKEICAQRGLTKYSNKNKQELLDMLMQKGFINLAEDADQMPQDVSKDKVPRSKGLKARMVGEYDYAQHQDVLKALSSSDEVTHAFVRELVMDDISTFLKTAQRKELKAFVEKYDVVDSIKSLLKETKSTKFLTEDADSVYAKLAEYIFTNNDSALDSLHKAFVKEYSKLTTKVVKKPVKKSVKPKRVKQPVSNDEDVVLDADVKDDNGIPRKVTKKVVRKAAKLSALDDNDALSDAGTENDDADEYKYDLNQDPAFDDDE